MVLSNNLCPQSQMIDQTDVSNYHFWLHIFPTILVNIGLFFFLVTLAYSAFVKAYFFFSPLPHTDVSTRIKGNGHWEWLIYILFIIYIAHCILSPLPEKTSWITNTVCTAAQDYTFGYLYNEITLLGICTILWLFINIINIFLLRYMSQKWSLVAQAEYS